MSNWSSLLRTALAGLESLEASGTPIRWWSFGGGTALMLQLHHRDSKDIDIFIPDAQYLGYLSPRLTDLSVWGEPDYDETTCYVKLRYAEGEIDFIAASAISDLPNGVFDFMGHRITIEPPAEIILKKLFHRAALLKPRDIFDTAVVLASIHADDLRANLHLVADQKSALLKRLTEMPKAYFDAAMTELDIFDDWQHIIPTARQSVLGMTEAISNSAAIR